MTIFLLVFPLWEPNDSIFFTTSIPSTTCSVKMKKLQQRSISYLSENHMLAIKPLGLGRAEEELRSIGVGASISHGQNTWIKNEALAQKYIYITRSSVFQAEVFILELVSIDGLATSSIASSEVASLQFSITTHVQLDHNHLAHEVGDDPVESRAFETKAFLSSAESAEILRGLGNHVGAELSEYFTTLQGLNQ